MKKNVLHLIAIMMVAMLSVGFISCSSDDDEGSFSHPIVGTWDRDIRGGDTQITFKSNMTAELKDRDDDDVVITATGDYKIDGNRITIHWKKISVQNVTIDMDLTESSLFKIDGDKMTTIADDGDVVTWTRK